MSDLPVRFNARRPNKSSEFARALQGELATRRAELTAARAQIADLEAKLATARRETTIWHISADQLQRALDSRPAINAGLPETYIRWSRSIYYGDIARGTASAEDD